MLYPFTPWLAALLTTTLLVPATLALPGEEPTTAATTAATENTPTPPASRPPQKPAATKFPRLVKSDRQWRAELLPNQYLATRRAATESAFTGIYWNHHEDGVYSCAGCGTPMFDSLAKFNSGTGWPSYWRAIDKTFLRAKPDISNGQPRTEILCRVCDAHLGHVFNDGPRPTGLRFCINSASINFIPRPNLPEHLDHWRESLGLTPKADPDRKPETTPAETKPQANAPSTPETSPTGPEIPTETTTERRETPPKRISP